MSAEERPYDLDWYRGFLTEALAELAAGAEADWQRQAVADLYLRFRRNLGDNDKRVLKGAALAEFTGLVDEFARALSAEVLASRLNTVPEHFRRHLLRLRGQDAGPVKVEIKSIMAQDGQLLIKGFLDRPGLDASTELVLRVGNNTTSFEVSLPDTGLRRTFSYFGVPLVAYRAFDVAIPLGELVAGTRIWWTSNLQDGPMPLWFTTAASRFAPDLGSSYAEIGGVGLLAMSTQLMVVRPTPLVRARSELRAFGGLLRTELAPTLKVKEFGFRLVYLLTRPLFGRRLVLYFDKLYSGGDNGQYLFEYASAQVRPGGRARHRYYLRSEAVGYAELRSRGLKLVNPVSPLRKLYPLNAHLIAATHSNVFAYCGLSRFESRWFSGVLDAHVVCIQHGLTVQHIPQHQAREIDNTERYFCASPVEVANLSQPEYGYSDDALRLTGLARYDGLVADTAPVVLLCPTWRRYVASDLTKMSRVRGYTPTFAESGYFSLFAALLTDAELLRGLAERGYRLRFVLHPTITAQAGDFAAAIANSAQARELVEIVAGSDGYTQHLQEAAVAITDYSGVQFDLAYLGRPVVYYLPPELPPSYPVGHHDPVEDGFGPTAADLPQLREQLWRILDRGAEVEAVYRQRAEDFFVHHDRDNCARIYAQLAKEYDLD